eukprot:gene7533-570_t
MHEPETPKATSEVDIDFLFTGSKRKLKGKSSISNQAFRRSLPKLPPIDIADEEGTAIDMEKKFIHVCEGEKFPSTFEQSSVTCCDPPSPLFRSRSSRDLENKEEPRKPHNHAISIPLNKIPRWAQDPKIWRRARRSRRRLIGEASLVSCRQKSVNHNSCRLNFYSPSTAPSDNCIISKPNEHHGCNALIDLNSYGALNKEMPASFEKGDVGPDGIDHKEKPGSCSSSRPVASSSWFSLTKGGDQLKALQAFFLEIGEQSLEEDKVKLIVTEAISNQSILDLNLQEALERLKHTSPEVFSQFQYYQKVMESEGIKPLTLPEFLLQPQYRRAAIRMRNI